MNSVNHNKLIKSIPCVQISHVTKRFGEDLVLKEVNLDLNYGQVYGIVGNNGSGKTVLMKCICGFLPAVVRRSSFSDPPDVFYHPLLNFQSKTGISDHAKHNSDEPFWYRN